MSVRILFVCYENICRSPMAEGVFNHLSSLGGFSRYFEVASAGTVCYQAGSCPDARAVRAADRAGIDISGIRAQCIHDLDLSCFDHVFVMDHENYLEVSGAVGGGFRPGVHLVTDFTGEHAGTVIEDPYYGPEEGFDRTLATLIGCARGILSHLLAEQGIMEVVSGGGGFPEIVPEGGHGSAG